MEQVGHADAHARVFVHVGRADAALHRADLLRAATLLLQAVEREVVGHDDVRALADEEAVQVHAELAQRLQLVEQRLAGPRRRRCR